MKPIPTKHTKGNWKAQGLHVNFPIGWIIMSDEGEEIADIKNSVVSELECEANAKVIALASESFHFVKQVFEALSDKSKKSLNIQEASWLIGAAKIIKQYKTSL